MSARRLSDAATKSIEAKINRSTIDPENGIPGLVFSVLNRDGTPIFQHASGQVGLGSPDLMTLDTIFWMASCTKTITGIACMQLVEQGKLELDSVEQVEKILPELKTAKVLKEKGGGRYELVDKKRGITLRMLLNHTAGFGYTFFNTQLNHYAQPIGLDEISGLRNDALHTVLANQPGERWEYGTNIDWAGQMVVRVSGMSLEDYFQKHIFKPLGLENITFFPSEAMKRNLAYLHQRENGKIRAIDHQYRPPLIAKSQDDRKGLFCSGGAGCFAKPTDYCELLLCLVNQGKHPRKNARILKPETVNEMYKNQIPEFPNFGRQFVPASKPNFTNAIPELYPQPMEHEQGWGLTFMLTTHPTATGRGKNTANWVGLPNLYWWADREKGVVGIMATQILPFSDSKVLGTMMEAEAGVYSTIAEQEVLLR